MVRLTLFIYSANDIPADVYICTNSSPLTRFRDSNAGSWSVITAVSSTEFLNYSCVHFITVIIATERTERFAPWIVERSAYKFRQLSTVTQHTVRWNVFSFIVLCDLKVPSTPNDFISSWFAKLVNRVAAISLTAEVAGNCIWLIDGATLGLWRLSGEEVAGEGILSVAGAKGCLRGSSDVILALMAVVGRLLGLWCWWEAAFLASAASDALAALRLDE